ncbi:MAG: hypothetical protein M5U13_16115 [Thermoanaerobaculia bacterium]|nr:hypothetical protein [Thermoanaerobaculia bacterium]
MWHDIDILRSVSQWLMWATFILGILTASATAGRYFVDRRVNELKSAAASKQAAESDAARKAADGAMAEKLAMADTRVQEANDRAAAAAAAAEALRLALQPRAVRVRVDGLAQLLGGRPAAAYEIETVAGDAEARDLGLKISEGLRTAGWTNTAFASSQFPHKITGLEVSAPTKTPEVAALVDFLTTAGLSPRYKTASALPQVHILVGSRE